MSQSVPLSLVGAVLAGLLLLVGLLEPPPAMAGPVEWREVPATAEGRQWWDAGSLRLSRSGALTVLSRFQPASPAPGAPGEQAKLPPAGLYVMELDCGQELFRDISVNGFPRFRAEWQAAGGDALGTAILRAACQAGSELLPPSSLGETG